MSRYFVSNARDAAGAPTLGTYWRAAQGFGGLVGPGDSYARVNAGEPVTRGADRYHTNLNLLAHALGDVPRSRSLVPSSPYEVRAGTVLDLQPFAVNPPGTPAPPRELPIGAKLAEFLDDPLENGSTLGLCLPWFDEDVVLGPSGGWLRDSEDLTRTFHGGIDASTRPRRLFDVAAAQEGEVIAVIHGGAVTQRGLVIEHGDAGGMAYRTIYQHMEEASVSLAVGDRVGRGQALGRICPQIGAEGADNSHLHFGVAVQGPETDPLWYFIDPFGVYDYRTDDTTYVPRTPEGMWQAIRGAERRVQWSSEVPAEALPIERLTDGYAAIDRIQVRVRRNDRAGGALPREHDQVIVWLGDDTMFFVPLRQAADQTLETVLAETLREAFVHGRQTRLAYRFSGRNRLITAAWVQA